MAIIKTPDQRVRVFISSTLKELADERKAARAAIENLKLIPVFFEAGARPHPPRDLYTAYLDQSHIFLGIYWNSYGWVAPGSEISGLEDEYLLCGNTKPKLIYVKKSTERQPRLVEMLKDIEKSDTACYQYFSDAEELQQQIENDLSILMSEIFENALMEKQQSNQSDPIEEIVPQQKLIELPLIRSEIYGRSEDLSKLSNLLKKPDVNLVTLLGAGGTGKSTLAIFTAHEIKDFFRDGVVFVSLDHVSDTDLVASTIAEVLDIQDSGKLASEQMITEYLLDKQYLLILDNFEQVIGSASFVNNLVSLCKDVTILVTSRTPLHVRHERIYSLGSLEVPDQHKKIKPDELKNYSATQLFVERALQVNPNMEMNQENAEAICEICQRMDGLPLAIELAAARTRFFQPAAILSRIGRTLDLVHKGHKDLPERQQTLRAAIDWSYDLLEEDTRKVFRQLGVFKSSWTLDAADAILNDGSNFIDIEEIAERLLDVSLIKPVLISHSLEPRFNMLQTVQEYALEMLESHPEAIAIKKRYAFYYLQLCAESEDKLWYRNGDVWMDKIETEFQNIRAAFYTFIQLEDYESAWKFIIYLSPYWIIRGGFSETKTWLTAAKLNDPELCRSIEMDPIVKGKALAWAASNFGYFFDFETMFPLVHQAQEILKSTDNKSAYGFALAIDGCYGSYINNPDAPDKIDAAFKLAEQIDKGFLMSMLCCYSSEYYRQIDRLDMVEKNLKLCEQVSLEDGNMYCLGISQLIIRHSFELLLEKPDYEKLIRTSLELYHQIPEKGYKTLKAAAMSNVAFSKIMLGNYEEVEASLNRGLEYTRQVAEAESETIVVLIACAWFKYKNQDEKAYKLLGALDAFIENSGFVFVGGQEFQYNTVKSRLAPELNVTANRRWYEAGKHIPLTEAVVYALK